MYDYLVIGAGLFGSVFAHEATSRGFKCLVIDRRDHLVFGGFRGGKRTLQEDGENVLYVCVGVEDED